uniref:Uncharacterized protein n=1 Tax=Anguilla anguilla TaxID=7936 RepID=A0A0E9WA87_ANGAN
MRVCRSQVTNADFPPKLMTNQKSSYVTQLEPNAEVQNTAGNIVYLKFLHKMFHNLTKNCWSQFNTIS